MIVRPYSVDDYPGLLAVQRACSPPPFPEALLRSSEHIASHCRTFPTAPSARSRTAASSARPPPTIIRFDPAHPGHTWAEASVDGYLTSHDAAGDTR